MIICIALFVFGLILLIRSGKRLNDLEKYEFENRSDGGVVQFASFKAAKKHEWREFRAKFNVFIGLFLILLSIGLFFSMQ